MTALTVHAHKTGAKRGAVLYLEAALAQQLHEWVLHLRPQMVPSTCSLVFSSMGGNPIHHLSSRIVVLGRKLGYSLPKLTILRKAVVTDVADSSAEDCKALAEHMCHSVATADRFYNTSEQGRRQKPAGGMQCPQL